VNPPKRKALFLVNRRARLGAQPIDDVRGLLQRGGIELVDVEPGQDDALSDLIRRRAGDCDLVIVGGGDGTLNGAAPGLLEVSLPLGVLPLGTANDFARTIGLPLNPIEAAKVIVEGHLQPIDLGEVNGHLFFNVASIGFSAELARELSGEAKRRWGR
jgi:diacylglycerol kinase (ATP)